MNRSELLGFFISTLTFLAYACIRYAVVCAAHICCRICTHTYIVAYARTHTLPHIRHTHTPRHAQRPAWLPFTDFFLFSFAGKKRRKKLAKLMRKGAHRSQPDYWNGGVERQDRRKNVLILPKPFLPQTCLKLITSIFLRKPRVLM